MEGFVTYIVPVYNGEKTIYSCVKSAVGMPYCKEIIVVNDGSTDSTEAICKVLQEEIGEKLIYIKQKNSGVSVARNTGMKYATGKYIGFVDADDTVNNDNWGNIDEVFTDAHDMIMFDYTEHVNSMTKNITLDWQNGIKGDRECEQLIQYMLNYPYYKKRSEKYIGGKIYQYFYKRQFIISNQILFDKDIVFAEDLCFLITCLGKAKSLFYYNEIGYNYNVYDDSASHKYRENYWYELKNTYGYLKSNVKDKELLKGICYYYAKAATYNYISHYTEINGKKLKTKLNEIICDSDLLNELAELRDVDWCKNERIINILIKHKLVWLYMMIKLYNYKYKLKESDKESE